MPTDIFLILTVILTSQGITLLIVKSSFRKKETIVLYGVYFIFNALLSTILIYGTSYKIVLLEYLRGYALFFTFFFLFMAWNSIVVPAKKWVRFSLKVMIAGLVVSTFHAINFALYTIEEQTFLIGNSYSNILRSEFWGIKISTMLIIIVTGYLIVIYMKRMIRVNILFLNYIMDSYSYIEESLIKYKNGIIISVLFVIIAFLTDLMMIFYDNMSVVIIYTVYQLLYVYIVVYIVFDFAAYEKYESKVTVYFANFLAETNTVEFNLFFPVNPKISFDDKHEELRRRLIAYFEESKPYFSKKLIMNDVARDLNTNRTYISKIINTDFDTTFFNFVNVFRIEEAKRQMEATSSYSLKAIADSCGFSSYTTFVKYQKMYSNKSADWYEKRETISK
ncbi:helix-turn-helix protein [Dysgonomonas alginatilytica]|uniref:Helix-turn-helix protein n=1 Tax=Dysgonomonas alginatilytica TaxID=1605892 RepID=A0A2V3PP30_9BACT|nr:helix-turn-helix domain-containing protein [Dysgonomonas alginatilytica]PXV63032.1 helix-turn-helix protein [Dysgonomonas alginatilytica]